MDLFFEKASITHLAVILFAASLIMSHRKIHWSYDIANCEPIEISDKLLALAGVKERIGVELCFMDFDSINSFILFLASAIKDRQ